MSKVNNPPAFPLNAGEFGIEPSPGMSLRDYFAGQALPQLLNETYRMSREARASIEGGIPALAASMAYEIADAMLKERAKG